MANPFQLFRRRQKVLLAIFGVAIMIAFVLSGALPNLGGSSTQARKNEVVVTTEYGPLRESDLYNLMLHRRAVDQVLQTIVGTSIATLVKNQQIDPRREQAAMENMMTQLRQELTQRFHQSDEEAAVETLVLAKKAEKMGVVVSDAAINNFLREITRNSDGSQILTSRQLSDILSSAKPDGQRISQGRMFDLLRQEMLASKLSRMFQASMNGLTPGQRWDYFEQLNRQATAQVLGVKVANFVSQVDDPSDKDVKDFYDQHDTVIATPGSPEPGFKEPVKAKFQFFEANYDRLVQEAKTQVTDEEIQKYYDEHKDTEFRAIDLPPVKKPTTDDDDMPVEGEAEKTPDTEETPEGEKKPADAAGDGDAAPDGDKKPQDDQKPADEKAAEPNGDATKDADKKGTENKDATKKEALKQSATPAASQSPFRLVSDPGAKPAADPAGEKAEEKPAGEEPAAEKPADAAATDKPAADDDAEKPAGEAAADTPATEGESAEKPKFDSLEKVRDTILNRLANDKAREATQKSFDNIEAAMQEYANQYVLYTAKKETDPNATPPVQLDLAELAKANNVAAKETALISQVEAADTELGRSYNIERDPRSPIGFRQISFDSFAFSDRLPLLRPSKTFDDAQNGYLFWKTEQVSEHTPPLDTVKDQVIRAWKMIKARELALAKAKEYADKVRSAKSTLKEVFANEKGLIVTETGPFSWLTIGSAAPFEAGAGAPRISDVPGVQYPGPAFMKTVFGLKPQEIGVALNQPESTAYAVQLIEFMRPVSQLEEQFASENFRKYAAAAVPDQRKIYSDWLGEMEKSAHVKWERPPRANREAM